MISPRARLSRLPYMRDSAQRFATVAGKPWAVFLDSGYPKSTQGRFDIIAAEPRTTIVTRNGRTEVRKGDQVVLLPDDPFEILRRELRSRPSPDNVLPFTGGAIGFFSYDLARRIERLPNSTRDLLRTPDMALGIYDWCVVVDHAEQRCWLATRGDAARDSRHDALVARFLAGAAEVTATGAFGVCGPVTCNMDRAAYGRAFRAIKAYIRAGDCYQVNFAQRFSVSVSGDPWQAYRALRERNPVPFGAYLNVPGATVLSLSPERFLELRDGEVATKPIKGTRPRGDQPRLDQALAEDLVTSDKDRAENLMIVDLLRNDLGRDCIPGSIRVPELFKLHSYANVHHLVSTVNGRLRPRCDALHLLRHCFPGGSITGAPKIRAMEIIEELEPDRRGVYCGAIGYLGFDGNMDTSIAIRTLVWRDNRLHFHAGGGIVADSREQEEYNECLDKVSGFLDFFKAHHAGCVGS